MALRDELLRRIEKRKKEIVAFQARIRESEVYIAALEETLKLIPREDGDTDEAPLTSLREGSNVAKARDALQRAGKPLHVSELLMAMGKPVDGENRAAIAGSLGTYARKREIFVRTGPNTFGLIETGSGKETTNDTSETSGIRPATAVRTSALREPPPTFGLGEEETSDDEVTLDEVPF